MAANTEVKDAITTLVNFYKTHLDADGKLQKEELMKNIMELKDCPEFQAKMERHMKRRGGEGKEHGRRKMKPDGKCDDLKMFCRLVGKMIKCEYGNEDESEDDQ